MAQPLDHTDIVSLDQFLADQRAILDSFEDMARGQLAAKRWSEPIPVKEWLDLLGRYQSF